MCFFVLTYLQEMTSARTVVCGIGSFSVASTKLQQDTQAFAMANRLSYILNITGPSFYLDTACSSSLTAMHLALQAIHNGECDGAIVGGCQINAKSVFL